MPVSHPPRLAVLAVALVLASGCAANADNATSGGATRVVNADNGAITVPADPKRVIATGYAVPVLIESGAALVGISSWKRGLAMMSPEHRATYDGMAKVAGELAKETNYEAIASAKPDLIVIGVPKPVLADIDMKRLQSIAPVVAIGPNAPFEWREQSRRQADAAGRAQDFDRAKAAYDKKAADLAAKYTNALRDLKFGHVGGYGDASAGNFQREFAGSWGTNVAGDVGVKYYGEVKKKGPGSESVSEYSSIEELPASLGQADAITYTLDPDGTPGASVKHVLESPLWTNLPAVKAGRVFPIRYTQASTYASAMSTLDSLDQALAPLLTR
ncbi:ABC transporter substrate-binding protein [Actinocrispum wychmicini]|uniref:Iron complex transport system substrate-binding protein n=1 Tax=Actinocrispum wychmicini TaxID=1213861 RepID=A0A4R2JTQ0_9PSEU|nr:ABC transporter substrate-binding protein [Actinocrispum wychmicini]TCO60668.1 iron complex transport system substrate-binding protein [Actinocrispum wychmicini]